MEFIGRFIQEYGMTILYAIVTAIAGYLGLFFKTKHQKYINDQTKRDVVKTCVMAVQQLHHDLNGPAKYKKAREYVSEMLALKGIVIHEAEIQMLIEAAVGEFKGAFEA